MRIRRVDFLVLMLIGCGRIPESPYFDNPQPLDATETPIPEKYFGTYESLIDSGLLTVTGHGIILKYFSNLNVPVAEIDSIDRLTLKDTVYYDKRSSMRVTVTDDSVYQRTIAVDTLYFTSNDFSIRNYKGFYLLNKRIFKNEDMWVVTTLRGTDKGLLIGMIKSRQDLDSLENWIEPDSITRVKPTDKELMDFLKAKHFENESKFVRIEYGLQQKL